MPSRLQLLDQTPTVYAEVEVSDDKIESVRASLGVIKEMARLAIVQTDTLIQEPLVLSLSQYVLVARPTLLIE